MGLVFGKAYKQYEDEDENGKPIFVTEMADGTKNVLTGWDATIAAQHRKTPQKFLLANSTDVNDVLVRMNPDDPRNTDFKYRLGKFLHDRAYDPYPSLPGRILNKGALPGGLLGAGVGLLGGAIGDFAAEKAGLDLPISLKMVGLLGLGGLGALLGHQRKKLKQQYPYTALALPKEGTEYDPAFRNILASTTGVPAPFMKRAAMFNNPRNFILEKLQADKNLGFAEKAKLAAAVRNLSLDEAEQLKALVRERLGSSIGTIVSEFIFNSPQPGALFGGLLPILSADFAHNLN